MGRIREVGVQREVGVLMGAVFGVVFDPHLIFGTWC